MTKKKKIIFGAIIIALGVGGYFGYKAIASRGSDKTTYTSVAIEKGTIVVSVSGTGQILSLDEVDIKSGASGDITYFNMENGRSVSKGTLLAKIDTTSLDQEITNDEIGLQQAQLALDKMNGTTTADGVLRGTKEKALDTLNTAYDDGFNSVSNIFLNLPNTMSGLLSILFSYDFTNSQWNIDYYNDVIRSYDYEADIYRTDAYNKYQIARKAYDQNFKDYKLVNRSSDDATIEALIAETYETTKDISEAIKSTNNLIQFYQDKVIGANKTPQTLSTTHLSTLSGYTSQTNGYVSTLFSTTNSIKTYKEAIINSTYDIQDQEVKVQTAKNTLQDAKDKLADYFVYAPFNGVIATTNAKKGDSISSGTVLASLITKQKIVEVSLNEVDASKVKVRQKATLTFDAIDGLSITGSVIEIDSLGTVSQGVVTYNVKIGMDTQDERVKTGMSVSASIVTDVKQDILIVPNAAIKIQNDINYVEVMNASSTVPVQQEVVIGMADESFTEIISGLSLGEKVVTKTVSQASKTTTKTATGSILNVGGSSNRNAGPVMMGR